MLDDFNPCEFECCDEIDTLDQIALDLEFDDLDVKGNCNELELEFSQKDNVDPDDISRFDSLVDVDDVDEDDDVPF